MPPVTISTVAINDINAIATTIAALAAAGQLSVGYVVSPAPTEATEQKPKTQAKEPAAAPKPAAARAAAPGPATAPVAEAAAPSKTDTASTPTVESAASPSPSSTAATEDEPLTYEDVKPRIIALHKAKGRDVAAAVLAEFGAKTGQELKPDDYPAVLARIQALTDEGALA